jgi:RNA 3'-terminal phosphate cyclase
MLRFKGSENFRQRLVCSTLSGKPIRIDDIRSGDENPGLRDYEASFLRLIEKITNGCIVEINETGEAKGMGCIPSLHRPYRLPCPASPILPLLPP